MFRVLEKPVEVPVTMFWVQALPHRNELQPPVSLPPSKENPPCVLQLDNLLDRRTYE